MKRQPKQERTPKKETAKAVSETKGPKSDRVLARENNPRSSRAPFPVVGIGASAGGLEAIEKFLGNTPAGSGMAFIVIQHLDPTHKGIMPELLQRATSMKVIQVKDGQIVQPNNVYVIPPNKDMSILHGVLHLLEPLERRGLRLPIDFFFRSLADDRRHLSIGVILSGMGTDGTMGLKALKETEGLAVVQDPLSAKFDGMPRSAIDAGLADFVGLPEELPARIIGYIKHRHLIVEHEGIMESSAKGSLDRIIILLRSRTGQDFSFYKKSTVYRRIERRMSIHQIDKIDGYVRFLQENPGEADLLFKELLIGVTSFFRDAASWELLKTRAIPEMLANRASGQTLRAWTAGCSTGEEAYSLAITFKEALKEANFKDHFSLQIFATDLDEDAINKARVGNFPVNIAADMKPELLGRYFVKEGAGYRVNKEIRDMVIFAPQNLVMDPPFTRIDILTCRNLLVYLTAEVQKKLFPLFHYSLNPGGVLFLGSAETVGGFADLFHSLDIKAKIYSKKESLLRTEPVDFPSSFAPARMQYAAEEQKIKKTGTSFQSLVDQMLLQRYSPSAVLVNDKGDILYVSGRTGKYLEPAAGKANWNIFAMAREGLRYDLAAAFKKALRQKNAVVLRGLKVGTNGGAQHLDLSIQTIEEPAPLHGMVIIVFTDVAAPVEAKTTGRSIKGRARNDEMRELTQELQNSREELQTTTEEMLTSQEELKSTNEELQSTNEELQSTNEELTTSKEEMQSMNEELQTVNAELQVKVDELSQSNNDMQNLLNSTEIATLFLDNELRVRRFTTQAAKIIKLITSDIGRKFTDLDTVLLYRELDHDVHEVLRTLIFKEQKIEAREGRWFKVRIMPYRTIENMIDGVVITFMDITESETLLRELRRVKERLETCDPEFLSGPDKSEAAGCGKSEESSEGVTDEKE